MKYLVTSKYHIFLVFLGMLCFLVLLVSADSSPFLTYLSNHGWPTSKNSSFWNALFSTISSSILLSIFLFFILSRYPQAVKERNARKALLRKYRSFKLNCIDIFVVISGADQNIEYQDLLEIEKFRDFFNATKSNRKTYWHDVANNLTPHSLSLLSKHIEGLRNDIEIVLNNYEILDDKDREQLERLSHHLRLIQTNQDDYDSIKPFCRSMWSIFTSWDWVEGYPESDRIEKLFSRI